MEFAHGLYHMMDSKSAFGELHSKAFDVGDIVEWSSWNQTSEKWVQNYGVITEVKNEVRHNRLVSITKVLPVNSNIEIIWQHQDLLATYKPPNLPMHEGGAYRKNTFHLWWSIRWSRRHDKKTPRQRCNGI